MTGRVMGPVDTCVVLAAGAGSRIAALGAGLPKSFLPIGNTPLARRQFEMLAGAGVRRVLFAGNSEGMEAPLREMAPPEISLEFTVQTGAQGIAHSLSLFEGALDGPFMVLLGDTFVYGPRIGGALASFPDSGADAALFVVGNSPQEAVARSFAVVTDEEGRAVRVVEKPDRFVSDTRGCGIYIFRQSIFEAIRKTPRSQLRNEYELTDSIRILIDSGARVTTCSPGRVEININTPEDLLLSNLIVADAAGRSIIDDTASVHPGAEVVRSVIGPGAAVRKPVRIVNTLIAAGSEVTDETDVESSVIFPGGRCKCEAGTI